MNVLPTIMTASGRYFNFLNPDPESIDIEDIAHALSHIARFTGHTRVFYSVAQHSVLVSHWIGPKYALQGLLHDATEAYVGDMSRPLKNLLPAYKEVEDRVWAAIAAKFHLPLELHPSVKEMDDVVLVTEKRDLTTPEAAADGRHFWSWSKDIKPLEMKIPWSKDIKPLEMKIVPWSPDDAKKSFLDLFHFLTALR